MPLNRKMRRHNLMVVENALMGRGVGTASEAAAMTILTCLAESVMRWMEDKTYTYEDQTYNLSDSVGCAIYKAGVLIKPYIPRQQASEYKRLTYHGQRMYLDYGHRLLESALNNSTVAMLGDYTLGVYAVMPYGLWVDRSLGDGGNNKRGKGWFSGPDGLKNFALNEFKRLKDEFIRSERNS